MCHDAWNDSTDIEARNHAQHGKNTRPLTRLPTCAICGFIIRKNIDGFGKCFGPELSPELYRENSLHFNRPTSCPFVARVTCIGPVLSADKSPIDRAAALPLKVSVVEAK